MRFVHYHRHAPLAVSAVTTPTLLRHIAPPHARSWLDYANGEEPSVLYRRVCDRLSVEG